MSSYDQGYTCIECSHSYDDRNGDLDERMCNECLDMTYEQRENMVYEQKSSKMTNEFMKFNLRIEDLELRSCTINLLSDGEHDRAEIVKWSKKTNKKGLCFTVAYWNKNEEGHNLQFVGNRPFAVDSAVFNKLAKYGQRILDDNWVTT
tara:strand:- start:146 stop:589 length:444 start_codon:yes stop_codon:yes gene_type:complete